MGEVDAAQEGSARSIIVFESVWKTLFEKFQKFEKFKKFMKFRITNNENAGCALRYGNEKINGSDQHNH